MIDPNIPIDTARSPNYNPIMDEIEAQTPEVRWVQDSLVEWHTESLSKPLTVKIAKQIKVTSGSFVTKDVRYYDNVSLAVDYIKGVVSRG